MLLQSSLVPNVDHCNETSSHQYNSMSSRTPRPALPQTTLPRPNFSRITMFIWNEQKKILHYLTSSSMMSGAMSGFPLFGGR